MLLRIFFFIQTFLYVRDYAKEIAELISIEKLFTEIFY